MTGLLGRDLQTLPEVRDVILVEIISQESPLENQNDQVTRPETSEPVTPVIASVSEDELLFSIPERKQKKIPNLEVLPKKKPVLVKKKVNFSQPKKEPVFGRARQDAAQKMSHVFLASSPSYAEQVAAHLVRFKHYPALAKKKGQEGTVTVWFGLSSQGDVIDKKIISTSGYHLLDIAALETIMRAAPYPTPSSAQDPQEFQLPIVYSLVNPR